MAARLQRIDELDSIAVAGVHWRPLRRTLGVTAFGTNAYTADAGEEVVEAHDETGNDHEEGYVVIAGRARFEVAGEKLEAGDFTRAYEICSARLADHPTHPVLNYQLACYAARAGDRERAIEHLRVALSSGDPRIREWGATDEDLESVWNSV